jgi:hypothetical protein
LLSLGISTVAFFQWQLTASLAAGHGCGGVPFGFSGCIDYVYQPPWAAWEAVWETYTLLGVGAIIGAIAIKRCHFTPSELRIVGVSAIIALLVAVMCASYP